MFKDRIDAGLQLSAALIHLKGRDGIVLAIPRGGVPIGHIVSRELGMPLELLLSKKIGHPGNPEFAIGAVSLTDRVIDPRTDVPDDYIELETGRIREKLRADYRKYMGDRVLRPLKGKTVIVVDDGIATGHTLLSTIGMLRSEHPKEIVVAVPVAPKATIKKIRPKVDELVVLLIPDEFYGVGGSYEDFSQVDDEVVVACLKEPVS